MKISFHGAARTVSGSNILVETENSKFIIDCGLFQGSKEEEKYNDSFDYDPSTIDFMILSHAHIDHSGRIPKLIKEGFNGPIFSTYPTADLAEVMLSDSAKIQENDAQYENKKRLRAGKELIEALYTMEDVDNALKLFSPVHYNQVISHRNTKIRFKDAGHILGSAIVEIWVEEEKKVSKICFSGDIGVKGHNIIKDPEFIDSCDYLILESTYGNTIHEDYKESFNKLINIILDTTRKGGKVIIPSFAVGRTQEIVYELNKYFEEKEGIKPPIFVDSPMAYKGTRAFMKNTQVFNDEAKKRIAMGDNVFEFDNLFYTRSVDDSKALNMDKSPMVIISSSGMATGGRVRHHLKHNLWDSKNAVVFVGYQANGSLGRILVDGIDRVKIFGDWIAVKADIYKLDGFSAHADSKGLMNFIDKMDKKPEKIFLVHGEEDEMGPFERRINEKYPDIKTFKPQIASQYTLESMERLEDVKVDINGQIEELQNQLDQILEKMDLIKDRQPKISYRNEENLEKIRKIQNDLDKNIMALNMLLGK